MKTFKCNCENTIFFENTQCVACGQALGWCPACSNMTTLVKSPKGALHCGNRECGAGLTLCQNYATERVCNRCFLSSESASNKERLCGYWRFNDTIPDLEVPGNREKWLRLEEAKRRLLYTLDLLKLPDGTPKDGFEPPLGFDFKADAQTQDKWWCCKNVRARVQKFLAIISFQLMAMHSSGTMKVAPSTTGVPITSAVMPLWGSSIIYPRFSPPQW